jgi:hypothetical protein
VIRRPSLVFGTAADWIKALGVADQGKRRLTLREQNFILDNIITAQDAEAQARDAVRERLPRRQLPRLTR